VLSWWLAPALAHSLGHGEVRHDLQLKLSVDAVELVATVELPEGLAAHDPAIAGNGWLIAGLQLSAVAGDGSVVHAEIGASGDGAQRTATARLPLPPEGVTVQVGDAALPGEATLLRWRVDDAARPVTTDQLMVFDGLRRRDIEGSWVRASPRSLELVVAPAPEPSGWGGLALAITLVVAGLGAAYSARRAARASAS